MRAVRPASPACLSVCLICAVFCAFRYNKDLKCAHVKVISEAQLLNLVEDLKDIYDCGDVTKIRGYDVFMDSYIKPVINVEKIKEDSIKITGMCACLRAPRAARAPRPRNRYSFMCVLRAGRTYPLRGFITDQDHFDPPFSAIKVEDISDNADNKFFYMNVGVDQDAVVAMVHEMADVWGFDVNEL